MESSKNVHCLLLAARYEFSLGSECLDLEQKINITHKLSGYKFIYHVIAHYSTIFIME
jgi:hypothetical protein